MGYDMVDSSISHRYVQHGQHNLSIFIQLANRPQKILKTTSKSQDKLAGEPEHTRIISHIPPQNKNRIPHKPLFTKTVHPADVCYQE